MFEFLDHLRWKLVVYVAHFEVVVKRVVFDSKVSSSVASVRPRYRSRALRLLSLLISFCAKLLNMSNLACSLPSLACAFLQRLLCRTWEA